MWIRATRRPRSFSDSKSPSAWLRISRRNPNGRPGIFSSLARVVHDLAEEADVRAALVQLPGRVEIARPVAVRHDEAAPRPQVGDERRDPDVVRRRRVDERLDADVVARVRLVEQLLDRRLGAELRLLAGREHLVRLVLRRLHVRLVERVDLEDRTGDGDRELPAEHLGAERVRIGDVRRRRLAVGPLRRLARRRDEPLAVLARGLGDQLLGPEAEAARRVGDADLVAAVPPALAERGAELVAGVVAVAAAGLGHLLGGGEQPVGVDPHQHRRHDPEQRQRGVAAADRRLAVEDVEEPVLLRERLERRSPGSVIAANRPPLARKYAV